MGIKNFTRGFPGLVDVTPTPVFVLSDDNLATITAAGYLNNYGNQLLPSDIVFMTYGDNISEMFTLDIDGSTITLIAAAGNVTLPVVSGDFSVFDGTSGTIKDAGYSPSNAAKTKVVMANGSAVVGNFGMFADVNGTVKDSLISPTDATKTKAIMASGAFTIGHNVTVLDVAGTLADGGLITNRIMTAGFATPGASAVPQRFDVVVTAAAIASGSVTIIPSGFTNVYRLDEIYLNAGGTNFSGGGGDRLGNISDGTTSYTNIPAATMQSLVNARWGTASVPFPTGGIPVSQTMASGQPLVFATTGGTANYTTGSLTITVLATRVS